jgi:hypothetical protein
MGSRPYGPDARLIDRPIVPHNLSAQESPVLLPQFQMAPRHFNVLWVISLIDPLKNDRCDDTGDDDYKFVVFYIYFHPVS